MTFKHSRFSVPFLLLFVLLSCDTQTTTVKSCGDGFLDPGEQCDGNQIPAQTTCRELGFHQQDGPIVCDSECKLDLSVCVFQCGDGTITPDYEDCEGEDLDGESCSTLGMGGGTLACNDACKFDTSNCEDQAQCGDGVLSLPFEQCEGTDLGGQSCAAMGYYGGQLLCDQECAFDLTPCEGFGRCGDNTIQSAYLEDCEGTDLGGQSCTTMDYYGGVLLCSDQCRFDLAPCEAFGRCGDALIQREFLEVCDGANLDGVTCRTLGLGTGTIECSQDCLSAIPACEFITLVNVPGGTFHRNANLADTSTVTAFRISETEITRGQWTEIMGTDPSSDTYSGGGAGDPVQRVNWYHAIAFCNKLSLHQGLTPVYSVSGVNFANLVYSEIPTSNNATWNSVTANWTANGYRLPTEMEWIWAAMGAIDAWDKPFAGSDGSNLIGDYAVFGFGSGEPGATPTERSDAVAGKLPNELGLYDMTGNVSEWVWDLYANYPAGALTDYRGPSSTTDNYRCRRGGDWTHASGSCEISDRSTTYPHIRDYFIGFRVVRK